MLPFLPFGKKKRKQIMRVYIEDRQEVERRRTGETKGLIEPVDFYNRPLQVKVVPRPAFLS